jgi:hypothetical protein
MTPGVRSKKGEEVMQKLMCLIVLGLGIMISGCATNPPPGLTKAYGDKGWSRVASQDTISIWRSSIDQGCYVVTKGEDIVAVVPTDAYNDWVDVYVDNQPALTVSRTHNTILGKADHKWKFQGKGSIEK